MNVSLRQLKAFHAGAKTLSFSKAAAEIGMTQPGYSLAIRQLEAEIGVKLFHRSTRRVDLTKAGHKFGQHVAAILNDLDGAMVEMRNIAADRARHTRFGVVPSIGARLIGPALQAFNCGPIRISASVIEDESIFLCQRMREEELDFAICSNFCQDSDLSFTPLCKDVLSGVFHKDDPILNEKKITWDMLVGKPFVAICSLSHNGEAIDGAINLASIDTEATLAVHLKPTYQFSHPGSAIEVVRSGTGFVILPEIAVASINFPEIVTREITDPIVRRTVGILSPAHEFSHPAANTAMKTITRLVKQVFDQRHLAQVS